MKHYALSLTLLAGMAHAQDYSITSAGITVKTCQNTAHAICSLKWNNQEFVNNYDHGRQLQSALSVYPLGESYNPTEAGSLADGLTSNPSTSIAGSPIVLASNGFRTLNQMAYWKPVSGAARSQYVMQKDVYLNVGTYASYLSYYVTVGAFSGEPTHARVDFETLTGYMPTSFSSFYTLDVKGTRALTALTIKCTDFERSSGTCPSPEQTLPLIFSNPAGTYAMGIYNRNLPQAAYPAAGFGRWYFTASNVVKWNSVFRFHDVVAQQQMSTTNYVVVGTLNNVKLQMQLLYDSGK